MAKVQLWKHLLQGLNAKATKTENGLNSVPSKRDVMELVMVELVVDLLVMGWLKWW